MKDETRWRREAEQEVKRQRKLARELWSAEKMRWQKRSGPGYMRWTEKESLNRVAIVTERALAAGAVWSDITSAIKIIASDPQKSPYTIFDEALAQASRREQAIEQAAKLQRERELREPRPQLGLRPLGSAVDRVLSNLKPDGQA